MDVDTVNRAFEFAHGMKDLLAGLGVETRAQAESMFIQAALGIMSGVPSTLSLTHSGRSDKASSRVTLEVGLVAGTGQARTTSS